MRRKGKIRVCVSRGEKYPSCSLSKQSAPVFPPRCNAGSSPQSHMDLECAFAALSALLGRFLVLKYNFEKYWP